MAESGGNGRGGGLRSNCKRGETVLTAVKRVYIP
jgi:hypothetical protein